MGWIRAYITSLCFMGHDANIADGGVLVEFLEPRVLPHVRDEQRTHHHVRRKALVKWKDRLEEGSTWANVSAL